MTAAISRNIPLLYLIKISKWFMLYIPAVKLFYVENGLNDTDLFVLHAFYSFVIFLAEVPSGYLADVIGRKKTMVGGLFLGAAGFAAYALTSSYTGFLLAEIALGLGQSFISGADSALLYDSLLQENKAPRYLRDESRITASGNAAEAIAGIVFTLLAFQSMRHYYAIQTFITIIGLWGIHLTGLFSPGSIRWRTLQTRRMPSRTWRCRRHIPRLASHDEILVAHWSVDNSEFEHAVEYHPAAARATTVEAEHKLV